jgi:hypothetical protein
LAPLAARKSRKLWRKRRTKLVVFIASCLANLAKGIAVLRAIAERDPACQT